MDTSLSDITGVCSAIFFDVNACGSPNNITNFGIFRDDSRSVKNKLKQNGTQAFKPLNSYVIT